MNISPDISEEELVKLARQPETEEEAFRLIVDRYSPMLYAVIRRVLITHDDTNDALQNTLIKVWKNLGRFEGKSKLTTWMYTIALNEARSLLRRNHPERQLPMETDTYSLAETLTSDPYFDGEWALQGDFRYMIPRGTWLGGKYGTGIRVNYAHVRGLVSVSLIV